MDNKLNKQQACQLYIEQEIESGLADGKTKYAIGKEIAQWVEKLFGAKVKPGTIEKRAQRIGKRITDKSPELDLSTGNNTESESNQVSWGGKREGAGRTPKFVAVPDTCKGAIWTGDAESYTPEKYIRLAKDVMGGIDVDPASNDLAQQVVRASTYYTAEDSGLDKEWWGNVFLNPPYDSENIVKFIDKLVLELESKHTKQAILLTNNSTDTRWFETAAKGCDLMCFTKGRINFNKPDGTKSSPTNGQTFFYFGPHTTRFNLVFQKVGLVMVLCEAK